MRWSTFQWKKGVFSEKGGGNSVNQGFGKDFYRKGNSVKRSGRFSEPPDSEKWKVAVLIPFPKISSYKKYRCWASKPRGSNKLGSERLQAYFLFPTSSFVSKVKRVLHSSQNHSTLVVVAALTIGTSCITRALYHRSQNYYKKNILKYNF